MSRLLALDQASKITGYAVFDDDGSLEHVGKFSFETPDLDQRLVQIRDKVKELINTYQINEVIYENIQQQSNVQNNIQTFKILAEVYGVISELLAEMEIPHSSVLATQWKSVVGIKGKTRPEQKRNAQEYVTKNYGIKVTQDESDAVCIGVYKLNQFLNDWSN